MLTAYTVGDVTVNVCYTECATPVIVYITFFFLSLFIPVDSVWDTSPNVVSRTVNSTCPGTFCCYLREGGIGELAGPPVLLLGTD